MKSFILFIGIALLLSNIVFDVWVGCILRNYNIPYSSVGSISLTFIISGLLIPVYRLLVKLYCDLEDM